MGRLNVNEYLNKFTTKEQVKEELERIQRNMDNANLLRADYHLLLWRKKQVLVEFYHQKYCTKVYYTDDMGRQQSYYEEI